MKLPNWTVAEKKVFVEHIAVHYKVGIYEEASGNQADRRTAMRAEAVNCKFKLDDTIARISVGSKQK